MSVSRPDKAEVELSVAICTRNRCASLLRAIESLAGPAETAWELLVVDNGSRDETAGACRELAAELPVPLRVVCEPEPGLSHARNRALAEAQGRVIVFLDDDATCHPGFVDAHARAFADPDVVASGGRIRPVLPPDVRGRLRRHLECALGGPTGHYDFGRVPGEIPGERGIFLPFGGNLGLLRGEALALGGFRSDLGFGGQLVPGEETALLARLAGRGRLRYVPGATVDHHVGAARARFDYFRRWHRGHGRSLVRMQTPAAPAARVLHQLAWSTARALRRALLRRDPYAAVRSLECAAGQLLELWDGRGGR